MTGLHLLRAVLARQAWAIAAGLLALLVVDALQLYVPRVIKHAVDDLTMGRASPATLMAQAGLVLGLALAVALMRMVWRPLIMGFSREVERDLRQRLFSHLQRMHLSYLAEHPPGELMARATNDLNSIRMASGIGLVAAVDGLIMGCAAVGFMLYISPLLTVLALLPMPLVVILTRRKSRSLHRRYNQVQDAFGRLTEQAREALAGLRLVKTYGLAGRESARLLDHGRAYLDVNLGLARDLALFFPLMTLLTSLSLAVVLGAGGWLTLLGRITAGDFVAFSAYLGMLTWPMMALGWVVSLVQRARSSLERVDAVLSARPAIADPAEPLPPPSDPAPGLELRDLTFTYPGAARPALDGVSLAAEAGATTALVGPVASGKSTLLLLATRLHDPPAGALRLGGVDVRRLRQADLRALVGMAPQEAFIFSASLRENLLLAKPDAGDDELWAALKAAELADEARALAQGLDTILGERGHTLSGGQRQRLALARALLADPPVLLLDDPLSAVDTETEQRILANLDRLRAGRTTLVVSHRLKSVAFARRIYVLDQGRVAQSGRHAELLAQKGADGLYARLFAEQALMAELEG
ncbi:MAG: ABC transporter ATP-binding protein [Thermodesulfobacteriota bacterium]